MRLVLRHVAFKTQSAKWLECRWHSERLSHTLPQRSLPRDYYRAGIGAMQRDNCPVFLYPGREKSRFCDVTRRATWVSDHRTGRHIPLANNNHVSSDRHFTKTMITTDCVCVRRSIGTRNIIIIIITLLYNTCTRIKTTDSRQHNSRLIENRCLG